MESLEDLLLKLKQEETTASACRATVAEATERRDTIKQSIQTERDRVAAEIYRLQQELDALVLGLKANYETAVEELYDVRKLLAASERNIESLKRQIEQMERANLKATEWATLEKRWDLLTAGAPWREWAKDHQLDAARKITYEGSLILGDTMGLGKTLSAIIAMDMIQAATADASPDNPIEFGSMK